MWAWVIYATLSNILKRKLHVLPFLFTPFWGWNAYVVGFQVSHVDKGNILKDLGKIKKQKE